MSKRPNIQAVPKEKPKKPLTHFFRFRTERIAALKAQGVENPASGIKQEWDNLPEALKIAEREKDKVENAKYRQQLNDWNKANPNEAQKSKPKRGKKDEDEEEEPDEEKVERKVEKSKGAKVAKGKGKKEEEVKEEKGKSKPKGDQGAKSKPKK